GPGGVAADTHLGRILLAPLEADHFQMARPRPVGRLQEDVPLGPDRADVAETVHGMERRRQLAAQPLDHDPAPRRDGEQADRDADGANPEMPEPSPVEDLGDGDALDALARLADRLPEHVAGEAVRLRLDGIGELDGRDEPIAQLAREPAFED